MSHHLSLMWFHKQEKTFWKKFRETQNPDKNRNESKHEKWMIFAKVENNSYNFVRLNLWNTRVFKMCMNRRPGIPCVYIDELNYGMLSTWVELNRRSCCKEISWREAVFNLQEDGLGCVEWEVSCTCTHKGLQETSTTAGKEKLMKICFY